MQHVAEPLRNGFRIDSMRCNFVEGSGFISKIRLGAKEAERSKVLISVIKYPKAFKTEKRILKFSQII